MSAPEITVRFTEAEAAALRRAVAVLTAGRWAPGALRRARKRLDEAVAAHYAPPPVPCAADCDRPAGSRRFMVLGRLSGIPIPWPLGPLPQPGSTVALCDVHGRIASRYSVDLSPEPLPAPDCRTTCDSPWSPCTVHA